MKKIISLIIIIAIGAVSIGNAAIIGPDNVEKYYHGPKKFLTESLDTFVDNYNNLIYIFITTNYPIDEIDYNIADVIIKGKTVFAIKLKRMERGQIQKNPSFITSRIFEDINESCKKISGEFIEVIGRSGEVLKFKASVEIIKNNEKNLIKISFPKKILQPGHYEIFWGTALCGNCLVEEKFNIFESEEDKKVSKVLNLNFPTNKTDIKPIYQENIPISTRFFPPFFDVIYPNENKPTPPNPPLIVPIPSLILSFIISIYRILRGDHYGILL